jgi:hypothetical protein
MRPRRVDANQERIVAALRAIGCNVLSLAPLGRGAPDLLVQYRQRLRMFEVKDGLKQESKRQLSPAEQRFHATWAGWRNLFVVTSAAEAVRLMTEGL